MSRNPSVKRILKESAELAAHPSPDFTAAPLESDLYEWHFTLRGPPAPSPFAQGIYHGRIVLPPAYPLKPPSFRFLTPTGRFEVNREICLSISGHHEETWQPAWGIRTALVAIRSFMDSEARGQVGGMESSEEVRRRLAGASRGWRCGGCGGGRTNEEVLEEVEEAAREVDGEAGGEEVPEELRLAYRDDLGKREQGEGTESESATATVPEAPSEPQTQQTIQQSAVPAPQPPPQSTPVQRRPPPATAAAPAPQAQQRLPPPQRRQEAAVPPWIDKAIYSIIGALIFLVWRKFIL